MNTIHKRERRTSQNDLQIINIITKVPLLKTDNKSKNNKKV